MFMFEVAMQVVPLHGHHTALPISRIIEHNIIHCAKCYLPDLQSLYRSLVVLNTLMRIQVFGHRGIERIGNRTVALPLYSSAIEMFITAVLFVTM